jgi:hypothetical protein
MIAGSHRAPADRLTLKIAQQTRNCPRINDSLHRLPVALALLALELLARQPPEHAPATAAGAVLAEKQLKIPPAGFRQRMAFEMNVFHGQLFIHTTQSFNEKRSF